VDQQLDEVRPAIAPDLGWCLERDDGCRDDGSRMCRNRRQRERLVEDEHGVIMVIESTVAVAGVADRVRLKVTMHDDGGVILTVVTAVDVRGRQQRDESHRNREHGTGTSAQIHSRIVRDPSDMDN
jgi:hypothetical protein